MSPRNLNVLTFAYSDPDFNKETDTAPLVVANQNRQRNIRCVLAYLSTRLTRVERLAWESGKHIPDHVMEKMSENELRYYKQYMENLEEYNKQISTLFGSENNNIDLTVDFHPPKDLFIEVRVNKDYGTVTLPESGQVKLQLNSTHLLRRNEVEELIKRGILSEVI